MSEVLFRPRRDGWTAERQAAFVAALTAGGSVAAAAATAGMSRQAAYRLRARDPAVAAAWGAAARPMTAAEFDAAAEAWPVPGGAPASATGEGSDTWLLRQLRAHARRRRRRAAYAAAKAGRNVDLCHLPPGRRGADGRFAPLGRSKRDLV